MIHYNQTSAIEQELDIFIPELKLAIEINGIVHYKPIYGEQTLERTLKSDAIKQQRCEGREIILKVIDVSTTNYSLQTAEIVLNQICNIITDHIGGSGGI